MLTIVGLELETWAEPPSAAPMLRGALGDTFAREDLPQGTRSVWHQGPTFQQAHRGPSVDACNGMGELSPARRDRPPLGAMPCLHQNAHCICYGAVRRPPSEGGRGHSWLAPHIGPKSG
jgi:hypothetical protein